MSNGNEPQRITVNAVVMGEGWMFFQPGEPTTTPHSPSDIPFHLHQAICAWLHDHPGNHVRTTLPLVSSGNTVGIHVWYDEEP